MGTFVEFDFGSDVTITGFLHQNRGTHVLDQILSSQLTFSSDNIFGGGDPVESIVHSSQTDPVAYSFPTQTARHVRWDVTGVDPSGGAGNQGGKEISFLATSGPMAQIANPISSNAAANHNSGCCNVPNILDNNPLTDYASNGQGANTFIDFDFGSSRKISGFEFLDRFGPADEIFFSKLTFSNDPSFSSIVGETVLHHAGRLNETLYAFPTQTAQYVRWQVTQTVNNVATNAGGKEIGFYEAIPANHIALAAPTVTAGATAFANAPGDFTSGTFSANHLFDGNLATEYSSKSLGAVSAPFANDGTFLELDLGAVVPLVGVEHLGRGPAVDGIITSRLIVSTDPVFDGSDQVITLDHNGAAVYDTFPAISGRYLRWEVVALDPVVGHTANVGGHSMIFYTVPEPSTLVLLLFSVVGIVAYRRRVK